MTKAISLSVKCPNCRKSLMDHEYLLMDKPSIKLNIETETDRGTIRLCSIYGCYSHESDLVVSSDEIVKFYCPHCNKELISKDFCSSKNCNAPMVPLILQSGGRVFFCSRKGCENHFIAFENLATEIRRFYYEYGY